jgi:hypothetical protein
MKENGMNGSSLCGHGEEKIHFFSVMSKPQPVGLARAE